MFYVTFIILTAALLRCAQGFTLTNKSVLCTPASMRVTLEFEDKFNGVVFTKNDFSKQPCKALGNDENSLTFTIPVNADSDVDPYCGVMEIDNKKYSADIIVSRLKNVLVAGLQEFTIQCQYEEESVVITSIPGITNKIRVLLPEIGVTEIVSGTYTSEEVDLPTDLRLTIRQGHGYTGDSVSQAYVGQNITLDISFEDGGDEYVMFIYNCDAHDGQEKGFANITLVDENGCGVEVTHITKPPLETVVDDDGQKHIYLPFYGFRFTTSDYVLFECQVKPCFTECESISQCSSQSTTSGVDVKESRDAAATTQTSAVSHGRLVMRVDDEPVTQKSTDDQNVTAASTDDQNVTAASTDDQNITAASTDGQNVTAAKFTEEAGPPGSTPNDTQTTTEKYSTYGQTSETPPETSERPASSTEVGASQQSDTTGSKAERSISGCGGQSSGNYGRNTGSSTSGPCTAGTSSSQQISGQEDHSEAQTYKAVTLPAGIWLPELPSSTGEADAVGEHERANYDGAADDDDDSTSTNGDGGDDDEYYYEATKEQQDSESIVLQSDKVKVDDIPDRSSFKISTPHRKSESALETFGSPGTVQLSQRKNKQKRRRRFRGKRRYNDENEEISSVKIPDGFAPVSRELDNPSFRKVRSASASQGSPPGIAPSYHAGQGNTSTTRSLGTYWSFNPYTGSGVTTTASAWSKNAIHHQYVIDSRPQSQYRYHVRIYGSASQSLTKSSTRGPMRKIVFDSMSENVHTAAPTTTAAATTEATTTTTTTSSSTTPPQFQNIKWQHIYYRRKKRQIEAARRLHDHMESRKRKKASPVIRLRLGLQVALHTANAVPEQHISNKNEKTLFAPWPMVIIAVLIPGFILALVSAVVYAVMQCVKCKRLRSVNQICISCTKEEKIVIQKTNAYE